MAQWDVSSPSEALDAGEMIALASLPLHSTDLLMLLDEQGIVLYESPAIKRLYGYDQDELVGETVTVDATVRNLGGAEGLHEVALTADGVRLTSENVSVDARSTETVSLWFEPEETGEYDLVVDDEAASVLSVEAVEEGTREGNGDRRRADGRCDGRPWRER